MLINAPVIEDVTVRIDDIDDNVGADEEHEVAKPMDKFKPANDNVNFNLGS